MLKYKHLSGHYISIIEAQREGSNHIKVSRGITRKLLEKGNILLN